MCGITGQFNFQRREPVERETIVRMTRSIAHRGPDDEGFFIPRAGRIRIPAASDY